MIGLAWWDSGGLQAEQFLMRDFGEEHSILHELAGRIAQRPVLVTFNGKAFDWPLLENRFTMTRAISTPRLAAHLDLLHPARALWKLRIGSVRLVELEHHVLEAHKMGWHREEDLLSAMIPQYYFDYLRGGPAYPLAGVVRHNQMDLRGLAALVSKIDALLTAEGRSEEIVEGLDLLGASRFLQRRGDTTRAHNACARAIRLGLPAEIRPQARRQLALLAKKHGDHETAHRLWQELAAARGGKTLDAVDACEQLAIYYERYLKDFARAAEFANLGLLKLIRCCPWSYDPHGAARGTRLQQKLQSRIARLERRRRGISPRRERPRQASLVP